MTVALTLAVGLLAAGELQAEPQKGWVVEVRGFHEHRQAKPEGWIIELKGFHKHLEAKPKELILEFLWPTAKPEGLLIESLEAQYHNELSAFFKQLEMQVQVEPVETMYFDDLPAFVKSLKQPMP